MGGYGFLSKLALIHLYVHCLAYIVTANVEGDALSTFKQQLNDPNGVLSSWDNHLVDPCTWSYITCDSENNVIRIELMNMGLSGQLVPELGKLASLQYLELFENQISGSIPPELSNLVNLASINLSHNALVGDIPTALGNLKNLKFMRLDHNGLIGEIPTELTYIPTLLIVDLSYNNLAGVVPNFASTVVTRFEGNPGLFQ